MGKLLDFPACAERPKQQAGTGADGTVLFCRCHTGGGVMMPLIDAGPEGVRVTGLVCACCERRVAVKNGVIQSKPGRIQF